jgi:hypothetical protein
MKFCLALLPMLAFSTVAHAGVFECDMTKKSRYGWISDKIYLEYEENSKSARIYDAYTHHYFDKKPLDAKVKRATDKAVVFSWELRDIETDSGKPSGRVKYTANIERATGRVHVNVLLLSYDNTSFGNGTCKYDAKRRF